MHFKSICCYSKLESFDERCLLNLVPECRDFASNTPAVPMHKDIIDSDIGTKFNTCFCGIILKCFLKKGWGREPIVLLSKLSLNGEPDLSFILVPVLARLDPCHQEMIPVLFLYC